MPTRKYRTFLAMLLTALIAAAIMGARPAPAIALPQQTGKIQPDSGTVSGNIYTNDYFGMSYQFPQGWHVQGKDAQSEVMERGHKGIYHEDASKSEGEAATEHHEALERTWFVFGATQRPGERMQRPSVQIVAFVLSGISSPPGPKEVLSAWGESLKPMGVVLVQEPTEMSVASHRFFVALYKFTPSSSENGGKTVWQASAITVEHGHAVMCFFAADSQSAVNDLVRTLDSVSFTLRPGLAQSGQAVAPSEPSVPSEAGVYLYEDQKMLAVGHTKISKISGPSLNPWKDILGSPMTIHLQGLKALTRTTNPRPIFYLNLGEPETVVIKSQRHLRTEIVKMKQKKDHREMELICPTPDCRVVRLYETPVKDESLEVRPGVWKVIPSKELKPGEYAFSVAEPREGTLVFDFGVEP